MIISVIIGAIGGFAGGNVVAPMLGAVVETPNDFSLFAMTIALAGAAHASPSASWFTTAFTYSPHERARRFQGRSRGDRNALCSPVPGELRYAAGFGPVFWSRIHWVWR